MHFTDRDIQRYQTPHLSAPTAFRGILGHYDGLSASGHVFAPLLSVVANSWLGGIRCAQLLGRHVQLLTGRRCRRRRRPSSRPASTGPPCAGRRTGTAGPRRSQPPRTHPTGTWPIRAPAHGLRETGRQSQNTPHRYLTHSCTSTRPARDGATESERTPPVLGPLVYQHTACERRGDRVGTGPATRETVQPQSWTMVLILTVVLVLSYYGPVSYVYA